MKRRLLIYASLCIPLGLLTSIAIAWYVAAFNYPPPPPTWYWAPFQGKYTTTDRSGNNRESQINGTIWVGLSLSESGSDRLEMHADDLMHSNFISFEAAKRYFAGFEEALPKELPIEQFRKYNQRQFGTNLPKNEALPIPTWAKSVEHRYARYEIHIANGLPFRCLRGKFGGTTGTAGVISLPNPAGPSRGLPLIPIWTGLLLNTTIYALAWAPILIALRYLFDAKRKRRRKGLCPHCAYDLHGTTACPECGLGMPQRRSPVTSSSS